LKDEVPNVRWKAARALEESVNRCENIEDLEKVEKQTEKYLGALRKKHVSRIMLTDDLIAVAKLTRWIAKKKDELTPKRDLLLDDKPKIPKKGMGIYQVSRRLRKG